MCWVMHLCMQCYSPHAIIFVKLTGPAHDKLTLGRVKQSKTELFRLDLDEVDLSG